MNGRTDADVKGGLSAAFFTLGCRVNQYETRAMEEDFISHGFRLGDFNEKCDVYVINTCTVTAESDRKCRSVIRRACDNSNGQGIVIVTGCYAQKSAEDIAKIDGVTLIIGTDGKSRVAESALKLLESKRQKDSKSTAAKIDVANISEVTECEKMSVTASDRTRAFIKIVDGCDNNCTYCIIPKVRGHVRSRAENDIVKEAEGLAKVGYKEIVLTGIETAAYGTDLEGKRGTALLSLVKRISEIDGVKRIRFGSLEPTLFTEEFTANLSRIPKVMPSFHISLQSGSSEVLALMKRKYNADMFLRCVKLLRTYFKDLTVTTDIIVGFPGESEESFDKTRRILREASIAYAHIFPYSKREGTPAAKMRGQLTAAEKKHRAAELHNAMISVRREILGEYAGRTFSVLMEDNDGKAAYGHTENFIETKMPYVKGVTVENEIVDVVITDVSPDGMMLMGKVAEK